MNSIKKFSPVATTVLVASTGAAILLFQSATAKPTPLRLPNAKILYLAPSSLPASEDIPGSSAALAAESVGVLYDFNDLRRAAEQNKPDALIVHQLSLVNVERGWISNQYHNGVIIAGINVKMTELAGLVSDPGILNSPWPDNWYKKPFYSYAGAKTGGLGGVIANGTNNINETEGNLQRFMFTLKLAVKNLKSAP